MLSTLLLVAAPLAAAGDHAALHPAGANLYFEAPDIAAAREAYANIPAARFAADEEVIGFVSQLLGREPDTLAPGTLVRLGADAVAEVLPGPGPEMLELMGGLRGLSLSVSGLELDGVAAEFLASGEELSEDLAGRLSRFELRGVMDLADEGSAARAAELIRAEAGAAPASVAEGWRQHAAAEDGSWTVHVLEGSTPEVAFWLQRQGARLSFALHLERIPEAPPELGSSFAADPAHLACRAALPESEGLLVYESYSSTGDLRELPALAEAIPGLGLALPAELGMLFGRLFPAGRGLARTRLVGDRFLIDEFEPDSGAGDAARLLGRGPVTRASYRFAPGDAVAAWAMTLDREGLRELVVGLLRDLLGGDPEPWLAAFEDDHGFRPDRDLLDALGGDAVLYTLPFTGVGLPKTFLAIELEDAERLTAALERLATLVEEEAGGLVAVNRRPYRKRPFFSFEPTQELGLPGPSSIGGAADMLTSFLSTQVAVGVLEDRVLLTYNASWMKREMRRWLSKDEVAPHPVAVAEEELPPGLLDHAVTDWGAILAGLYDGVRGLLPLLEQGLGEPLPFAAEDMPAGERFTAHFRPTVSWSRAVEGGVLFHRESSFGPEMPWLLGAGAVGAVLAVFDVGPEVEPVLTEEGEAAPVLVDAEPWAPGDLEARALADLRSLRVALVVFASESGGYPATLEELRRPTKNFPEGFVTSDTTFRDPWGRPYRYEIRGEDLLLWSLGADGADEGGEGDDVRLP
jgi:hypothetical protein